MPGYSHIVCTECTQKASYEAQSNGRAGRACPVCHADLATDYMAYTNLQPTEEYKTCVLGGLSPNIVMECAGRAINFWSYQTTQEAFYQVHLYKILKDKYAKLSMTTEKALAESNLQIEALKQRISGTSPLERSLDHSLIHAPKVIQAENEAIRRKNDELTQAYREKHRRFLQAQELYDRVKRQAEMGTLQQAASDAVDHTVAEVDMLASQAFDRGNQSRDLDTLPPVPIFGTHRGNVQSNMNTGAPRSRPGQMRGQVGEDTSWRAREMPPHCKRVIMGILRVSANEVQPTDQ